MMTMATSGRKWTRDTAAERLEDSFARIGRGSKGTAHIFTEVFVSSAREEATGRTETMSGALGGALVSIKDLLDVKGYVTRAGSPALMDQEPAGDDADCVALLRAAGAVLVGHTNMTELAYSGIGMNPYFGTPENALYPGCAPGGSTSGGAISVALGLCDIAIGSDTGGSLRIPAAFNGLVGFKPTQRSVPRTGGVALSATLDSFGPIAHSVADCADCWRVMAGAATVNDGVSKDAEQILVVPTNFGRDTLDPAVEAGFTEAQQKLKDAGFKIVEEQLPSLDFYGTLAGWKIAAFEALRTHQALLDVHALRMDRRVLDRIRRGEAVTNADYEHLLVQRAEFVSRFADDLAGRYLLLPTVATLPPSLKALADDTAYGRLNALVLRNTSLGNFADSCSISLPFRTAADTIGIMVSAAGGRDEDLLSLAGQMESVLAY